MLSPTYRHAQRLLARWLEDEHDADGHDTRFAVRAAWHALDAVEHDRMARWLAWLCLAASRRGDTTPMPRLQRLDAALGRAIGHAMHKLPGRSTATSGHLLRLSA